MEAILLWLSLLLTCLLFFVVATSFGIRLAILEEGEIVFKESQLCIKKQNDPRQRPGMAWFPDFKSCLFTFLDPLKLDVPEEKSTASQQQQSTSKNFTEEELEEWLDSMIS